MSPARRSFPAKASSAADSLQYDEEVFAKDFARLSATLDGQGYKGIKYDQEKFKKDCEAAEIPWPPPGLSQSRWATPASAPPAKPSVPKKSAAPVLPPSPVTATSTLSPLATPFVPQHTQEPVVKSSTPDRLSQSCSDKPPAAPVAPAGMPLKEAKATRSALGGLAQSSWATPTPTVTPEPVPTPVGTPVAAPRPRKGLGQSRRSTKTSKSAAPRKRPAKSKPVTTPAPVAASQARPRGGHLGGLAQSRWVTPSPDSSSPASAVQPVAPAPPPPTTSESAAPAKSKPDTSPAPAAVSEARPRGGNLGGLAQSRWSTPSPDSSSPASAIQPVAPAPPTTSKSAAPAKSKPVTSPAPAAVSEARPRGGKLGGLAQSRWSTPAPDSSSPASAVQPVAPAPCTTAKSKPDATGSAAVSKARPRGSLGGLGQSRWAKQ